MPKACGYLCQQYHQHWWAVNLDSLVVQSVESNAGCK